MLGHASHALRLEKFPQDSRTAPALCGGFSCLEEAMKRVTEYRRPAIEQMNRLHSADIFQALSNRTDRLDRYGRHSLRNFSAAAGGDDDDADDVIAGASQASDGYVGVAFASGKGDYRQSTRRVTI
jgi:hypothetical protein